MYKVVVLTISDKCSKGERRDGTGPAVQEMLLKNHSYELVKYEVIPDEPAIIKERLIYHCDVLKADLILTNGGTGFTERDVTPEATRDVLEREVPGIPEAMRVLNLSKTKRAMLSRGIAGIRAKTLIVNLPGSQKGAIESLEPVLDTIGHGLDMIRERGH
ncbi:MAG: MogA/MoaB family molybdenum cofactor biosynthesis protein [Candidatus Omnitrophota bacterium]